MDFAVVDVETTGGRTFGGDRILEVAVVHVSDGVITTAVDVLVDPQRAISPFVSRLTGITARMVSESPTFGDLAETLREALGDRTFVAHNARFDWRFMSMEMERATGRPLLGKPLCTLKIARKLLPHLSRRSLDALSWYYEVPNAARHRAGGDARATAQIFTHMLADSRRQDVDTWEQLQDLLRRPRMSRRPSALPQSVLVEAIA